ncbi:hypothetical protein HELRODRAFT_183164 [Helobdella robusta]|uniref:Uncharacterized protein n=1 Tax=Helobdella robusta TaxID=6412 RepID=T1FJ88_HELRO|nr:hypothetical protein HELRODRAFT_183164 [Helobdella robusta]ESO11468.1 hypothetical protein HELRODRAFT_183164 [Helobdella robusta]
MGRLFRNGIWRPKLNRLIDEKNFNNYYRRLKVGLLNSRSVCGKATKISSTIDDDKLDMLIFTETWHKSHDDYALQMCIPCSVSKLDVPRTDLDGQLKRGGGLAIIYNELKFKLKHYELGCRFEIFETLACLIKIRSTQMLCEAIYGPGSVAPEKRFIDEFSLLLSMVCLRGQSILILEDFNIHTNDNQLASNFMELVSSFGSFRVYDEHLALLKKVAGGKKNLLLGLMTVVSIKNVEQGNVKEFSNELGLFLTWSLVENN